MKKLLTRIGCAILTFSIGVGVNGLTFSDKDYPQAVVAEVQTPTVAESRSPIPVDDWTSFSDLLTDEETVHYNGYVIERRYKDLQLADWLYRDQGFVVVSKNGKHVVSFDELAYHPLGNITEFGLFSFLGSDIKQLAISQSVPRGGMQWIVDLSSRPRVIFDGDLWRVGRDDADCLVEDLDGDSVFEISLPITDFYALMDKMAMSDIPLPTITFKYNSAQRKYLPANHFLRPLPELFPSDADIIAAQEETSGLRGGSIVINNLLTLIYAGKREQAWRYFNATYNLADKKEIERRVKAILRDQPVYKFIYKKR